MTQVKDDEVVLPAIQRRFVWDETRIAMLFDSIMRGYPIGITLLWESYHNIQYRYFDRDFREEDLLKFHRNSNTKRLKLVLDGQQRLQSIYIALYGSHNGQELYFNVLSGHDTEDLDEWKYLFNFLTDEKAKYWNEKYKDEKYYYLKVKDIFELSYNARKEKIKKLCAELNLSEEDANRLDVNISLLSDRLSKDEHILEVSVIDNGLPPEHPDRKKDSDIAEVFHRINDQGIRLDKADLIFSFLVLNWDESAALLPEFVHKLNQGNAFEIDKNFVIRSLFAVSNLGTKFNVDILRKIPNIEKIKTNYKNCCSSIESTLDFIQKYCRISNTTALGGYNNYMPIVYYLFHCPKHIIPNSEIVSLRKTIFALGFAKPFSRWADSRLWQFIRDVLKPRLENRNYEFPYSRLIDYLKYWENIDGFNENLLNRNHLLVHYLVQGLSSHTAKYDKNNPEMDHIFPKSILYEKEFNYMIANHFANFWILEQGKNQNKTNKHPKEYFKDYSDKELGRLFIDRKLLDYSKYKKFLEKRTEQIKTFIEQKTELSENDFAPEDNS